MERKERITAVLLTLTVAVMLACGCRQGGGTAASGGPAGASSAPVEIRAFYPLNEAHKFIADYLRTLPDKYDGKVSVDIFDIQTAEGREEWETTGLLCAGVFVNGSTKHEIKRDEETETVDFIKRMGVYWTEEDLEAVIDQLLASEMEGEESE